MTPSRRTKSDKGAMVALLRANARAGELRNEDAGLRPSRFGGIVRGAPTHDLAYLLTALEEDGWKLVKENQ